MARSNTKPGADFVQDERNADDDLVIDMDDLFDDDAEAVGSKHAQDSSVRLTDISEIVAKYSVVDRFFTPEGGTEKPAAKIKLATPVLSEPARQDTAPKSEPKSSEPKSEDREDDAGAERRKARAEADQRAARELAKRREARAEADRRAASEAAARRQAEADRRAAREEADRDAEREAGERRSAWKSALYGEPEVLEPAADDDDVEIDADDTPEAPRDSRPSLFGALVRTRHSADDGDETDDLHSNWRDTAKDAFDDMHRPQAIYPEYTSPLKLASLPAEDEPVVRRHKRALVHTVALCAALPIVAGATFALTLYVQKDIKPTELWGWATASMTSSLEPGGDAATQPMSKPADALVTTRAGGSDAETPTAAPAEQVAVVAPETPEALQAPSPAAAQQYSAPPTADSGGSPATQYFMARLTVEDAEGMAAQPIPLAFNVTRGRPEQRLRIRISGIPDGGLLSAGRDLGNGEWRLRESDLEDLTMTLPAGYSGDITLLAMVIDDATHIQAGAPSTLQVRVTPDASMVEPASAAPAANTSFATSDLAGSQQPARGTVVPQRSLFPELTMPMPEVRHPDQTQVPETQLPETRVATTAPATSELPRSAPVAQSMSSQESARLIDKGDRMMGLGDIAAARLFYERALKSDDVRAAIAMGKTYDPLVFDQLQVRGVAPDAQTALSWYSQGAETGNPEAIAHFEALDAWLRQ